MNSKKQPFDSVDATGEVQSAQHCSISSIQSSSQQEFDSVLKNNQLVPFWQSVRDIQRQQLFGYEALIRGPLETKLHFADKLFGTALALGREAELEKAALQTHLTKHNELTQLTDKDPILTLNITPFFLFDSSIEQLLKTYPNPSLLKLELTEHLPVDEWDEVKAKMDDYRAYGYEFWLDDVGCGFFDLQTIDIVKPEVTKLCISTISRLGESDQIILEIERVVRSVHAFGGKILAEGIETELQLTLAQQIGIDLAQGFFFDKPRPMGS